MSRAHAARRGARRRSSGRQAVRGHQMGAPLDSLINRRDNDTWPSSVFSLLSVLQEFVETAGLEVDGAAVSVLVRKPTAPSPVPSSGSVDKSSDSKPVSVDGKHEQHFTSIASTSSKSSQHSASPRVTPAESIGFESRAQGGAAVIELGAVNGGFTSSERETNGEGRSSELIRSSGKVHPLDKPNTNKPPLRSSSSESATADRSGIGIAKQFAFSSQLQRSSVLAVRLRDSRAVGAPTLFTKGAPETIAKLCRPDSCSLFRYLHPIFTIKN